MTKENFLGYLQLFPQKEHITPPLPHLLFPTAYEWAGWEGCITHNQPEAKNQSPPVDYSRIF